MELEFFFPSSYFCKKCVHSTMLFLLLSLISLSFYMEEHSASGRVLSERLHPTNKAELQSTEISLQLKTQKPVTKGNDLAVQLLSKLRRIRVHNTLSHRKPHLHKRQISEKDIIELWKCIQRIRQQTSPSVTMSSLRFR